MNVKAFLVKSFFLFLLYSCNSGTKVEELQTNEIQVTIPVEFEQNEEIKGFIYDYQSLVNEINVLNSQLMNKLGIDENARESNASDLRLSTKQLLKASRLVAKQAELSEKRDYLIQSMGEKLKDLPEDEQRALRGTIGNLDAQIRFFQNGDPANVNSQLSKSEADPEAMDEETKQLMKEREIAIQHLKDTGQWQEPEKQSKTTLPENFWHFLFFGVVIVFLIVRRMKGKRVRSSFVQRLSHVSGNFKEAYAKVPIDELKTSAELSEEEREQLLYVDNMAKRFIDNEDQPDLNSSLEESDRLKSLSDLRQLYDTELKDSIAGLEKNRKSIVKQYFYGLFAFISCLLAFILIPETFYLNVILGIAFIVLFIVFFLKGITRYLSYRKTYKAIVVKRMVFLINPKYKYDPNKHLALADILKSKLIDNVNLVSGDDYVCGKIDKTVFEFSELLAQYEYETTDSDGKKVKRVDGLFNGIFFLADFNKHIKGETYVLPDFSERWLGKIGQKLQSDSKGELVKLENPEFENYFAVFSTNQTEARYILTPAIMEGIVAIRKKINRELSFSFVGECVYCSIPYNKALFEASIFKTVNFESLELMYSLFSLIETIVREMNLNARLWTKD